MGAEDAVQIGELVVPKGHHGQVAVNDWIAAMMSIYQKITGTDPGIFRCGARQAWKRQSRWSSHSFLAGGWQANRYRVVG